MMYIFITELSAIICIFFTIFISFFYNKEIKTSIVLIISAILLSFCLDKNLHFPMFNYTDYELIIKIILFISSFLFYRIFDEGNFNKQIFSVLAIICICLSISASNFVSLVISMDLTTIFICIYHYQNKQLNKLQVTYIMIASIFLIIATGIIYALVRTTSFNDIQYILSFSYQQNPFILLAILLIFTSFCIKLGIFPLHHLMLEYSNGAYSDLWNVFCVFRCSSILILHKLITTVFYNTDISFIIFWIGIISIIFASFLICIQTNIKKIFLYIIIYNSGIAILSSLGNGYSSRAAIIFLITSEIVTFLGLFGLINTIKKCKNKGLNDLDDLKGLSKWNPILSLILSFLFLSIFGIPPFIGFWNKFHICLFLLHKNLIFCTGLIIISMLIMMICLIKILIIIWIRQPEDDIYFVNLQKTKTLTSYFIIIMAFISIPIANKIISYMMMEI